MVGGRYLVCVHCGHIEDMNPGVPIDIGTLLSATLDSTDIRLRRLEGIAMSNGDI